jgi:predicted metal-dependent hydrolase
LKSKGERISHLVSQLQGDATSSAAILDNPFYLGFFQCWNEQRYYEAHDVLEQLWLKTKSEDANFFKGLIQAAGAFVHLQKQFQHPTHPKHGRRLSPAVRLFRLAEQNLEQFAPVRHGLDVAALRSKLCAHAEIIVASRYEVNPWSPETAPKLELL